MSTDDNLLDVRDLKVHFPLPRKHMMAPPSNVHAVDGVSFQIKRGTTFGLVGESGSGKTTTALAVLRLVEVTSGSMRLGEADLATLEGDQLRQLRRRMQIIFQDPYSSLNPRTRAGGIVREPLDLMDIGEPGERDERVAEIFRNVGLRPEQQALFPHQFSGGQRQRIGIARALAVKPEFLVCDEAIAALDVSIQAQVINLFMDLRKDLDLTYLFISHDLSVVEHISDRVVIMYLGRIVEKASTDDMFDAPNHPYTQALLNEVPRVDSRGIDYQPVSGEIPSPLDPPPGCHFHPRCPHAMDRCRSEVPVLQEFAPGRVSACHLNDQS